MTIDIGRREFISALGATTLVWPLAAHAQRAGKVPTIGVLGSDASSWRPWAAFTERLRELGWIDAQTMAIEFRWSQGRPERVAEIGAEFVRQKVDVVLTYGGAVAISRRHVPSPSSLR
jgi:putative ABC transport system substrate-binding protein